MASPINPLPVSMLILASLFDVFECTYCPEKGVYAVSHQNNSRTVTMTIHDCKDNGRRQRATWYTMEKYHGDTFWSIDNITRQPDGRSGVQVWEGDNQPQEEGSAEFSQDSLSDSAGSVCTYTLLTPDAPYRVLFDITYNIDGKLSRDDEWSISSLWTGSDSRNLTCIGESPQALTTFQVGDNVTLQWKVYRQDEWADSFKYVQDCWLERATYQDAQGQYTGRKETAFQFYLKPGWTFLFERVNNLDATLDTRWEEWEAGGKHITLTEYTITKTITNAGPADQGTYRLSCVNSAGQFYMSHSYTDVVLEGNTSPIPRGKVAFKLQKLSGTRQWNKKRLSLTPKQLINKLVFNIYANEVESINFYKDGVLIDPQTPDVEIVQVTPGHCKAGLIFPRHDPPEDAAGLYTCRVVSQGQTVDQDMPVIYVPSGQFKVPKFYSLEIQHWNDSYFELQCTGRTGYEETTMWFTAADFYDKKDVQTFPDATIQVDAANRRITGTLRVTDEQILAKFKFSRNMQVWCHMADWFRDDFQERIYPVYERHNFF